MVKYILKLRDWCWNSRYSSSSIRCNLCSHVPIRDIHVIFWLNFNRVNFLLDIQRKRCKNGQIFLKICHGALWFYLAQKRWIFSNKIWNTVWILRILIYIWIENMYKYGRWLNLKMIWKCRSNISDCSMFMFSFKYFQEFCIFVLELLTYSLTLYRPGLVHLNLQNFKVIWTKNLSKNCLKIMCKKWKQMFVYCPNLVIILFTIHLRFTCKLTELIGEFRGASLSRPDVLHFHEVFGKMLGE